MTTAIFDSHGFVKRLTAAGMPECQAEVLAHEHLCLHGQLRSQEQRPQATVDVVRKSGRIFDELTIGVTIMVAAWISLIVVVLESL